MKNVLVTGSNGQLGQTLHELYFKNSVNISFVFVTKLELDITNYNSVLEFFQKTDFDYCINCAAYTNVEQAEKTPEIAFLVNAQGTKNLAKVCELNSTILIHISTDYVFDGTKAEPYTVLDKTNPINEYGKSKLLGEQHIQEVMTNYYIIRTSWLYSKKYGKNFYRTIFEKAKTVKELFVTDEQTGCPTNTENLANYIVSLIQEASKSYGVKHFSDNEIMTWYDFAKQILIENSLLSKVNVVKSNNYVTFAKRPKNTVLIKKR